MQQSIDFTKDNLKMSQEHANALNLIKNNPKRYITRAEIVKALNKDVTYYRRLNNVINELVTDFRLPIGSSSNLSRKGYFYCENEADFRHAEQTLISRIEGFENRLSVLRDIKSKALSK